MALQAKALWLFFSERPGAQALACFGIGRNLFDKQNQNVRATTHGSLNRPGSTGDGVGDGREIVQRTIASHLSGLDTGVHPFDEEGVQ